MVPVPFYVARRCLASLDVVGWARSDRRAPRRTHLLPSLFWRGVLVRRYAEFIGDLTAGQENAGAMASVVREWCDAPEHAPFAERFDRVYTRARAERRLNDAPNDDVEQVRHRGPVHGRRCGADRGARRGRRPGRPSGHAAVP